MSSKVVRGKAGGPMPPIDKPTSTEDQIKAGIRRLVAEKGRPVEFQDPWYEGAEPRVSEYGWTDSHASEHVRPGSWNKREKGCEWVIPEGTIVKEETYSQFMGTFTSNEDEVGLNASGVSCKCGKYKDVTLRVTSSLGEAIRTIIGYDPGTQLEI